MSLKLEDAKAELIERAAAIAHDRLSGDDAASLSTFIQQYYAQVAPEDLIEIDVYDLYGAAVAHRNLARDRPPGTALVRVYTPQFAEHGWQSTHTVVEIVTDDMPFLVDSVRMELLRQGLSIHLTVHPVIGTDSLIHVEV